MRILRNEKIIKSRICDSKKFVNSKIMHTKLFLFSNTHTLLSEVRVFFFFFNYKISKPTPVAAQSVRGFGDLQIQAVSRAVITWMDNRLLLANIGLWRPVSGRLFFLRPPWCVSLSILLPCIQLGIKKNLRPSVSARVFCRFPRPSANAV